MTIIGRTELIPHFRHRKEKRRGKRDPKVMEKYERRAVLLSKLGYASYAEYLASGEWKAIRGRVLVAGPLCVMCDRPAAVCHHVKYEEAVLLGLDDARLAPLCHRCHESIEVVGGKKASLPAANAALFAAARKTPHGLAWSLAYHQSRKFTPRTGCIRGPNWKQNRQRKRQGKAARCQAAALAPLTLDSGTEAGPALSVYSHPLA